MSISDEVKTTRQAVLDMAFCREDYGHDNQIMRGWLWSLLGGSLTDAEIAEFAQSFADHPDYGEEDAEAAIENLTAWRRQMTAA